MMHPRVAQFCILPLRKCGTCACALQRQSSYDVACGGEVWGAASHVKNYCARAATAATDLMSRLGAELSGGVMVRPFQVFELQGWGRGCQE